MPSASVPRGVTDCAYRDWAAEKGHSCEASTPSILIVAGGDGKMTYHACDSILPPPEARGTERHRVVLFLHVAPLPLPSCLCPTNSLHLPNSVHPASLWSFIFHSPNNSFNLPWAEYDFCSLWHQQSHRKLQEGREGTPDTERQKVGCLFPSPWSTHPGKCCQQRHTPLPGDTTGKKCVPTPCETLTLSSYRVDSGHQWLTLSRMPHPTTTALSGSLQSLCLVEIFVFQGEQRKEQQK